MRVECDLLAAAHEHFGGVVPEIASRHHLEIVNPSSSGAERRWCRRSMTSSWSRRRRAQASWARCSWACRPPRRSRRRGSCRSRRSTTCRATSRRTSSAGRRRARTGPFEPPFLCLIASGGHTLLAHVSEHHGFEVLGRTLDDAAGEAFDKGARMLGPRLSRAARRSSGSLRRRPEAFSFPGSASERSRRAARAPGVCAGPGLLLRGREDGAAVQLRELSRPRREERAADLAASYQAAIVDSLIDALRARARAPGLERLAVGGGVAANGALRARLASWG